MTLTLAQALTAANREREAGRPAAIATVVASSVEGIAPGDRAVVGAEGVLLGDMAEALTSAMLASSSTIFSQGEPALYSYMFRGGVGDPVRVGTGNVDVYVEVVTSNPRLIVVGAGHIAVPLAKMATLADFEVVVVDDRPEYLNRERFPDAERLELGPYRETVARLGVDARTYLVLVTRGHVHDQACLEEALTGEPAYVGMIGSKRRVRTVAAHAVAAGAPADKVKRVFAPIGLDIGARTPGEIAVAILAEIVAVRRGKPAHFLALRERLGV